MKKILLLVILLGLTACGSDDRPADSSNSGVKGDDAQTACKDACVNSSSMVVEFNESEIPKSSEQRVY